MTKTLKFPAIPLAQTVVRLCQHYQVERIVISAGSRNAPLTNGFVSNSYFKTYSVVDERAAAFFALGMAQQLQQPVALVCTSGSALLNYYPSIAEAYYSDIPLVVLSADRMPHRIDIGDGQTIRQTGVFEPHLETAAVLKPDVIHATKTLLESPLQTLLPSNASPKKVEEIQREIQNHNTQEIHRVLNQAMANKGPVHLNIPLEEPLYEMKETPIPLNLDYTFHIKKDSSKDLKSSIESWHQSVKKWVIIGVLEPNAISVENLEKLCNDPSVVVFTETTSNINHPKVLKSIDTLMAPLELSQSIANESIQPELLMTFGGMVVSKKIKQFLRKFQPKLHWHIHEKKAYNTYYCLDQHIRTTPDQFLSDLYKNASIPSSDFHHTVFSIYQDFKRRGNHYLNQIQFSDLKVFETLASRIPESLNLQIANSSSIRYAQLLDWSKGIHFFCNRGTSGIDGSTATAVGAAQCSERPTVLITGDLSFFYDINGLWNQYIPSHFRIILINNKGGGIFRILPGEKDSPNYDQYFETVHNRDARFVAKTFGLDYYKAHSQRGLKYQLSRFFKKGNRPKLLEIQTPRTQNDRILLDYFKAMVSE
jgi:2-succinyl-5-enolpyruvyl-6-hydroxy-3-cyclohexene-1-carboxylate synthase